MARLLYVATLLGAAVAVPWEGAVPTSIDDAVADYRGFSPAPTQGVMDFLQVFAVKRDVTDICGYENQALTSRRWCTSPFVCATNTEYSAYGCCRATRVDTCNYKTSCVPYVSVKDCGAKCEDDLHLRVCDDPEEPYCETAYSFTGTQTFTGFACRSTSSDLIAYVFPTFTSDTRSRPVGTPHRETITITIGESIATITHQPADATVEDGPEEIDATAAPGTTSARPPENEDESSDTPVGAIVGGVVGGLVALAAIVGLVVFYLLRRKKTNVPPAKELSPPVAAADAAAPRRPSEPPGYTAPAPGVQAYLNASQPPYGQQQYHPGIPPAPYGGPPPPFVGATNGYYDPKGMPIEMSGMTSPSELGPSSPTMTQPLPASSLPVQDSGQQGQAGPSTGATPSPMPQGPVPGNQAP